MLHFLFAQLVLAASLSGPVQGTAAHPTLEGCAQDVRNEAPAEIFSGVVSVADACAKHGVFSKDWLGKAEDNICGLRDLSQVSNPAVIDFQACLDATPEMKKVKAEKIDLKSPEGIRLLTEATNRVTQACESVQKAHGYCSVWKSIKHKDGRTLTDISSQVTALF